MSEDDARPPPPPPPPPRTGFPEGQSQWWMLSTLTNQLAKTQEWEQKQVSTDPGSNPGYACMEQFWQ